MFFSVWLTLLYMTASRSIHISANDSFISYITQWYSLVYMDHIFFIHSSFNGYLDCFHVLAIVNSAAWTLGCTYPFRSCFSPDICPGVRLQDHMVALFLVFLWNLHTVLHSDCTNLHFQSPSLLDWKAHIVHLLPAKYTGCKTDSVPVNQVFC